MPSIFEWSGWPIAPIAIQVTNFGLKNDMIQQVHNSCQFHGLPSDDANKHLDKFVHVTQSIKVNRVTGNAFRLYLFPHSLTHHATAWFDRLPKNSINTFEQMAKMFLEKYFPPSMVTKLRNEITNFRQRPNESLFEAWECYKLYIDRCPNHNMLPVTQIDTFYNSLTLRHRDTINAAAGGTFMKRCPEECYDLIKNITAHHNNWDTSTQRSESSSSITSSSNTKIAALKAEMVEIYKNLIRVLQPPLATLKTYMLHEPIKGANQGQNQPLAYQAPLYQALVHQPQIPQPQVVTTDEFTNFMKANDAILKNMQTNMTSLANSNLKLKNMFGQFMKMNNASSLGSGTLLGNTITNPKEDLKGITTRSGTAYQGLMIPTTSSSPVVERETEATKDTVHPTYNGSTKDIQPLVVLTESPTLNSKPVICPINESVASPFSAMKHNQRPSIPYPSRLHDQKLPLADLGGSINLMPLFVWNKLSLPDLSPTCMTLELSNRLISRPVGVAEDVFVKVGIFHFLADLVVVDFDADPRTSRYSANYNDMMANRIDVIDMTCEEYSQEALGFFDVIASGNPTLYYDLIVSTTSPTLTPFGNSDFLLEEGNILLLEAFLNDDPSLPPSNQGNHLPEVELKDLPPHLEYAFLEGDDKLPVIIAKDLSVEEETALIIVLKSHTQAIARKLSDIKGIELEFCTHKILMEEDFEPVVQHQRRVNPKIYDVIKQEVLKLLDAGLIYPIPDSPWVSPVHSVPKKGGFTVVENEENELILTRLVTGWRFCIDYHKLNEATRKDHFPLPFMDQMLDRLAGNQYYCFLDGFSGYFQIPINPKDQEKTTFTYPYKTFAYRRMPFRLCNAPDTFQRCMMAIFHDMIEKTMEVFMDDLSVFRNSFQTCLSHLDKMLKRIEVDKAKVDVIAKLPHPTTVKGIQSFLGHVGYYRRFIKDFSKIARPMTRLLKKDTLFLFSKKCVEAFETLKRKLFEAPILISPDWDMPFKLMCDASDFPIDAILGQRQEKHFRPIHYASKTMTKVESNYTTTEKEMLAVVYAFEKLWSYLIMNKSIVYTDHSTLKYLFAKKDSKARLLRWVLLLQEFTFKVIDTKGAENLAADHIS
nr:reverse transcriptase domain-containing protein [Tanacetum cinerariifolium]